MDISDILIKKELHSLENYIVSLTECHVIQTEDKDGGVLQREKKLNNNFKD